MEKPLLNKKNILERFSGKGDWTYARIPKILAEKNTTFVTIKIRGFIDSYQIRKYHLMPMGNGVLMLPVKAEIRKKIKKEEGD